MEKTSSHIYSLQHPNKFQQHGNGHNNYVQMTQLQQPLEQWISPHHHPVQCNRNNNIIYCLQNHQWTHHKFFVTARCHMQIALEGTACNPHVNSSPIADLQELEDHFICSLPYPVYIRPPQRTPQPTTFKDYCKTLPAWTKCLLQDIDFVWNKEKLGHILQAKEPLDFFTDGGVTNGI
eukprot:9598136-Ditylum_brightwellii.AAC.1